MKMLFKRLLVISIVLGLFICSGYTLDIRNNDEYVPEGNLAFDYFCDVVDANHIELEEFIEKYGGAYIEGETLTILYRYDLSDSVLRLLQELLATSNYAINMASCSYSYQELRDIIASLYQEASNHSNDISHWSSSIRILYINQMTNKIVCKFLDYDGNQEEKIELALSEFPICLEKMEEEAICEEQSEMTTTINPGDGLSYGNTNASISLGVRCIKNGEYGFLTTIHSASTGGIVKYNGTTIGTVTASVHDSLSDFSFVKLTNNSYSIGNHPKSYASVQLSSSYISSFPYNYIVFFAGRSTPGIRGGNVIDSSFYDFGYCADALACSFTSSAPGDSGGLIYSYSSGSYRVCGIFDGQIVQGNTIFYYATKYTTIIQDYYSDISLY